MTMSEGEKKVGVITRLFPTPETGGSIIRCGNRRDRNTRVEAGVFDLLDGVQ